MVSGVNQKGPGVHKADYERGGADPAASGLRVEDDERPRNDVIRTVGGM